MSLVKFELWVLGPSAPELPVGWSRSTGHEKCDLSIPELREGDHPSLQH